MCTKYHGQWVFGAVSQVEIGGGKNVVGKNDRTPSFLDQHQRYRQLLKYKKDDEERSWKALPASQVLPTPGYNKRLTTSSADEKVAQF